MTMDLRAIELALTFLGRAQLTGNEVPDFVHATNALHAERSEIVADMQRLPVVNTQLRPRRKAPTE